MQRKVWSASQSLAPDCCAVYLDVGPDREIVDNCSHARTLTTPSMRMYVRLCFCGVCTFLGVVVLVLSHARTLTTPSMRMYVRLCFCCVCTFLGVVVLVVFCVCARVCVCVGVHAPSG